MNILGYRREISAVLPRVLASFDTDPLSASAGVGDRLYWSWKHGFIYIFHLFIMLFKNEIYIFRSRNGFESDESRLL